MNEPHVYKFLAPWFLAGFDRSSRHTWDIYKETGCELNGRHVPIGSRKWISNAMNTRQCEISHTELKCLAHWQRVRKTCWDWMVCCMTRLLGNRILRIHPRLVNYWHHGAEEWWYRPKMHWNDMGSYDDQRDLVIDLIVMAEYISWNMSLRFETVESRCKEKHGGRTRNTYTHLLLRHHHVWREIWYDIHFHG
jgi:hypothetical protein